MSSFTEVDRIKRQQSKRVEDLIAAEGRNNPETLIKVLGDLLAETSAEAILDKKAWERREAGYQASLKKLQQEHQALSEERKRAIELLTQEGLYYPESKDEEALPFWISGLLSRLEANNG